MFIPNTTADVYRRIVGDLDLFGRESFAPKETLPCGVVTYDVKVLKSSVRADTSASRGQAEQEEGIARFLFLPQSNLKQGDVIKKDGMSFEVIEVHIRRNVLGKIDHHEVDMKKTEV